MKKSPRVIGTVSGNAVKYESYREAWVRIQLAQENDFFLEAITIEESIISDRLISFLTRPSGPKLIYKNKKGNYPHFADLIKALKRDLGKPLNLEGHSDIVEELNAWRYMRNRAVHALVSSEPGEPTTPVDKFLQEAKEAARIGAELARCVSTWHKVEKRKSI